MTKHVCYNLPCMQTENPIARRLVDHFGSRRKAASALEVTPETIRLWLKRGIPLESCIEVEKRSRGIVTAEEILRDRKYTA